MFGVDNVRHMFGIPLPKNVCGRKRSNIRLLRRILIFLIKHIVFPQFGVPNNIVDFDVMITLLFGMSNVIQFFINLIMLG